MEGVLSPQLLLAETVMLPFCPEFPVVTIIEVDPEDPVIVHPTGTVHEYKVAPGTGLML